METVGGAHQRFPLAPFLAELDAIFAASEGLNRAEPHLLDGLAQAEDLGDKEACLSILNELLGLYRSQGRPSETLTTGERALAAVIEIGKAGTEAHATTLINVATAHRAAGRYAEAEAAYRDALQIARATMAPTDRRLAALHNNLSLLLSETGRAAWAHGELMEALSILQRSSVEPSRDLDIAGTHSNLALLALELDRPEQAREHAARALAIFREGGHEGDSHYAAALAAQAQVSMRLGAPSEAATLYRQALGIVAQRYGTGSDAYSVTAANLAEAERAAAPMAPTPREGVPVVNGASAKAEGLGKPSHPQGLNDPERTEPETLRGMDLARAFWEEYGRPLIEKKYPEYRHRIAAGLVGRGSECYGFDDEFSQDHDFGPGFCLWLTGEDYLVIGEQLQADYDALPEFFRGVQRSVATPRASEKNRRVGVFEVGDFFEGITGYREAPPCNRPHEWLSLEEATLAAATNGEVFVDALGAVGALRGGFLRMPDGVRLALIGRRLGMMAQAGQYNVERMLARGDGEAAWLSVGEFVRATASVVFLLNRPWMVGYLPYYKWHFAALRKLADRPAARLPGVVPQLSEILKLASAACLGGSCAGKTGPDADHAHAALLSAIEAVCAEVVMELRIQRLSDTSDTFLERQRDAVQSRIRDPWLRSL